MALEPSNPDDTHRALDQNHILAASLSHVEMRQVRNDYTLRWDGKLYQIERSAVSPGLRGAEVRIEQRLDGSLAVRHGARYLAVQECTEPSPRVAPPVQPTTSRTRTRRRGSDWNKNFDLHKAPKLWQIAEASGYRPEIVE